MPEHKIPLAQPVAETVESVRQKLQRHMDRYFETSEHAVSLQQELRLLGDALREREALQRETERRIRAS